LFTDNRAIAVKDALMFQITRADNPMDKHGGALP